MSIGGRMSRTAEVTLLDISSDEITLKADIRLNLGSQYSLKLHEGDNNIALRGTVLWSSLAEIRQGSDGDAIPFYKAAIKLANVSEDVLKYLAEAIASSRCAQADDAWSVTADADGKERMLLHVPEEYRVKKISLGGMLIETACKSECEARFPMEIALPGNRFIKFEGRVASRLNLSDTASELCDVGIEFLNMTEQDRERLAEFIQTLDRV